jgi:hypothetical protein
MTPKRLTDLIARVIAKRISRNEQTANLAKQLLDLKRPPRIREVALQASLQRAERWSRLGFA